MFSTPSKFYFILFTFIISTTTPACARFQGLYAGANLGVMLLDGTHTYTNGSPQEGKVSLKGFSYIVGLQGGYMYCLMSSKIVIGAELGFSLPGLSLTKELQISGGSVEGKVTIRCGYQYGFALLGGVALNPKVMMYAKMGLERSKFDLTYSQLTFQTPTSEKHEVAVSGFTPGLGIHYKLSQTLLVGAEYTYSLKKKIQLSPNVASSDGVTRGYTFSPTQHRLVARVIHIF